MKEYLRRNTQKECTPFFTTNRNLVACINIKGLTKAMDIDCEAEDWRLFSDAYKYNLNTMFLHNGMNYDEFQWDML